MIKTGEIVGFAMSCSKLVTQEVVAEVATAVDGAASVVKIPTDRVFDPTGDVTDLAVDVF